VVPPEDDALPGMLASSPTVGSSPAPPLPELTPAPLLPPKPSDPEPAPLLPLDVFVPWVVELSSLLLPLLQATIVAHDVSSTRDAHIRIVIIRPSRSNGGSWPLRSARLTRGLESS
jgi:hypothetical protein